jgi:muconolactone delta-isomerase
MRVLAVEIETKRGQIPTLLLQEEARRVYELYKKGKIQDIFFSKKEHKAIILFEVRSLAEVTKLLKSLPLVKAKYINFKLIELLPYSGYDRIIAKRL